jgi:hypothetical protein
MSDTDSNRVDEFVQELMPWLDTPDTTPVVLERTALANFEYRAKTGEMLRAMAPDVDVAFTFTQPKAKRTLRERLVRLLTSTDACDWEDCA